MAPTLTATELKSTARTLITAICNDRNLDLAKSHNATSISMTHDDNPPITSVDDFLANWQKLLTFMPDFHLEILDMVAEVGEKTQGGKVWVFSRIKGLPGGVKKDSVDMMDFDADGKFVRSKDVQRVIGEEVQKVTAET